MHRKMSSLNSGMPSYSPQKVKINTLVTGKVLVAQTDTAPWLQNQQKKKLLGSRKNKARIKKKLFTNTAYTVYYQNL